MARTTLISEERARVHVAGYLREPQDTDDITWANLPRSPQAIADDTDWAEVDEIER